MEHQKKRRTKTERRLYNVRRMDGVQSTNPPFQRVNTQRSHGEREMTGLREDLEV